MIDIISSILEVQKLAVIIPIVAVSVFVLIRVLIAKRKKK